MKERGFTLTEVLGVIVILGLIALIIFPNVNKSIKNSKQKLYHEQILFIEENARKWGVEHTAELPDSGSYYLKLNELVSGGYISQKELKDPRDESTMEGCIIISYDPAYNQYKYTYTEVSCEEQKPVENPTLVEKINTSSEIATNDPDGNKRYVGENPNNYVRFNNELWRVIGVFNGQVKIIRNDFYSTEMKWNSSSKNDWSTATLQTELNTTYWDTIDRDSQNMVDQSHVWKLGGWNTSNITRAEMYQYENGTTVYYNNPTEWTGKIALMYPSDYAYASSGDSTCDSTTLYYWDGSPALEECAEKSWLYNVSSEWLLTHSTADSSYVFLVQSSGNLFSYDMRNTFAVRPVLYLKSDVKVESGSGSNTSPYHISL